MNLRDQLQTIYETRGVLTPAVVVDEARHKDHPLHPRFEWDNKVAGEAYRRQQAHDLIQSVQVMRQANEDEPSMRVRAWHAVRSEKGHTYEPVERVMADPLIRQMVFMDMEREWRAMKARYDTFQEFWELVREDMTAAA